MSRYPDPEDKKRLLPALEVLGGAAPPESKTLTEDELQTELDEVFGSLEEKKERAVMQAAFDRYCEARAAAGDVIPEAYFGHELIDWRPEDESARERWLDLATAVSSRRNAGPQRRWRVNGRCATPGPR